jgi:hypothetical protein
MQWDSFTFLPSTTADTTSMMTDVFIENHYSFPPNTSLGDTLTVNFIIELPYYFVTTLLKYGSSFE